MVISFQWANYDDISLFNFLGTLFQRENAID